VVQAVKFLGVGVFCAATHYVIYIGLVAWADFGVVPATLVGWLVSTGQSYVLNARYTFQSELGGTTMIKFWIVIVGGGAVNAGAVAGMDGFGVMPWLSGIVAIGLGAICNFVGHKLWTFREE
jgi:putative flippase GtrA